MDETSGDRGGRMTGRPDSGDDRGGNPAARPLTWTIVLPVKRLRLAKTRLSVPAALRAEIVLAMAVDTATAALSCPRVDGVVVVSDDDRAAGDLRAAGAVVVADEPDAGLNPALAHGVAVARAGQPGRGVATLSADLPGLRPAELATALDAAAGHPLAVVADRCGSGTTLLTARPDATLVPAYGQDSYARHVAAGHAVVDVAGIDSLRLDVDTLDDLRGVAMVGVGARTAALLPSVL